MIRDWLIDKLGGMTEETFEDAYIELHDMFLAQQKDDQRTIERLQALIPVSAVIPKKPKGRPKKVNITPVKAV